MSNFASNTTNITAPLTNAAIEGGFASCDGTGGMRMTSANFNAVLNWLCVRIAQNETDIAAETAARIAADNILQLNINAANAARIAGDNALQIAINNEIAARIAGDNALQANINAANVARANGDAAEAAARAAAITAAINAHVAAYHSGGAGVPALTDVGQFALASVNITANINAGDTRAGGQLFWSQTVQTNGPLIGVGTWRAHFHATYGGGPGQESVVGLWQRIS